MGLDAGYLSRILRGFEERGLIGRKASEADGRQSHLFLTRQGQKAFAKNIIASLDLLFNQGRPVRCARGFGVSSSDGIDEGQMILLRLPLRRVKKQAGSLKFSTVLTRLLFVDRAGGGTQRCVVARRVAHLLRVQARGNLAHQMGIGRPTALLLVEELEL